MTFRVALSVLAALALTISSPAQDKKQLERLQKLFHPDTVESKLHGEYVGKVGTKTYAAQVVDRGEKRFHALLFPNGLPGDGWDNSSYVFLESEPLTDGKASFASGEGKDVKLVLSEKGVQVKNADGEGVLTRVERKSPTLGMAPPAEAVVLFDGKGLGAFLEKSTMEPNASLTLYEGALLAGFETKQKFKDFTLHLEFMHGLEPDALPWRRADSGVYLLDRYEVAIGDSCGFDFDIAGYGGPTRPMFFSENTRKGGRYAVYSDVKLKRPPVFCGSVFHSSQKVPNHCFPPLTWQTLDIEFTAPRFNESGKKTSSAIVSVKLNGLPTVDRQAVAGPTAHGAPGDVPEGPIWFQGYLRTVLFRNIWLVEKEVTVWARRCSAPQAPRALSSTSSPGRWLAALGRGGQSGKLQRALREGSW